MIHSLIFILFLVNGMGSEIKENFPAKITNDLNEMEKVTKLRHASIYQSAEDYRKFNNIFNPQRYNVISDKKRLNTGPQSDQSIAKITTVPGKESDIDSRWKAKNTENTDVVSKISLKNEGKFMTGNMLPIIFSYLDVSDLKEMYFISHLMEKEILHYFDFGSKITHLAQYAGIIRAHMKYSLEYLEEYLINPQNKKEENRCVQFCSSLRTDLTFYTPWITRYVKKCEEIIGTYKLIDAGSIIFSFIIRYSLFHKFWIREFMPTVEKIFCASNLDLNQYGSVLRLYSPQAVYEIHDVDHGKKSLSVEHYEFYYSFEQSKLYHDHSSRSILIPVHRLGRMTPFFVCIVRIGQDERRHLLFRIDQLTAVVHFNRAGGSYFYSDIFLAFIKNEKEVFITKARTLPLHKNENENLRPFVTYVQTVASRSFSLSIDNNPVKQWLIDYHTFV